MKYLVKISIRLFLVFTIFQFIYYIVFSINDFIGWNEFSQTSQDSITIIEIVNMYLPFIIVWCIYIICIILLWIKSETIANKIVGINQQENINITLGYESILSVGLVILGFFLIFDSLPGIFSYIANLAISKSRFVDKNFLKEYTIKQIVEIIGIILKILLSFMMIKYNEDIVKKINNINKIKSNGI